MLVPYLLWRTAPPESRAQSSDLHIKEGKVEASLSDNGHTGLWPACRRLLFPYRLRSPSMNPRKKVDLKLIIIGALG